MSNNGPDYSMPDEVRQQLIKICKIPPSSIPSIEEKVRGFLNMQELHSAQPWTKVKKTLEKHERAIQTLIDAGGDIAIMLINGVAKDMGEQPNYLMHLADKLQRHREIIGAAKGLPARINKGGRAWNLNNNVFAAEILAILSSTNKTRRVSSARLVKVLDVIGEHLSASYQAKLPKKNSTRLAKNTLKKYG